MGDGSKSSETLANKDGKVLKDGQMPAGYDGISPKKPCSAYLYFAKVTISKLREADKELT
jgi:hypothetical protein